MPVTLSPSSSPPCHPALSTQSSPPVPPHVYIYSHASIRSTRRLRSSLARNFRLSNLTDSGLIHSRTSHLFCLFVIIGIPCHLVVLKLLYCICIVHRCAAMLLLPEVRRTKCLLYLVTPQCRHLRRGNCRYFTLLSPFGRLPRAGRLRVPWYVELDAEVRTNVDNIVRLPRDVFYYV